MKMINISMPILEFNCEENRLKTKKKKVKSVEIERKNKIESPRKKMRMMDKEKKDTYIEKINESVKEMEISNNLEEEPMNDKKEQINLFKEIDFGGYTLFISPKLEEQKSNEEFFTTKNLAKIIKKEHKKICEMEPYLTPNLSYNEKSKIYPTSCLYSNYNKNRYKDVLAGKFQIFFLFIANSN